MGVTGTRRDKLKKSTITSLPAHRKSSLANDSLAFKECVPLKRVATIGKWGSEKQRVVSSPTIQEKYEQGDRDVLGIVGKLMWHIQALGLNEIT